MLDNIVINHNDIDPISLEKINELPINNVFYVKNKLTNNLYAYDAANWFVYISNDRRHPITKNQLSHNELWELYLTTIQQIPYIKDNNLLELIKNSINKYNSKKILLKKINKTSLKIIPESPLMTLKINYFKKIEKTEENKNSFNFETHKLYKLRYSLMHSLTNKEIISNLKVTLQIPKNMFISFGF